MRTLLFIALCLGCYPCFSQKTGSQLVDSLVQTIPVAADDTAVARTYNRIFNELINTDFTEALRYARTGLAHVKQMKWSKGIGVFQDNLGRAYSGQGMYDSCIFYYTASLQTHTVAGNKQGIATTYNNLGVAAQNIKGDFTRAADYYFKSLHATEEIKDSVAQSNALQNIAAIYMLQKNYDKALEFNKRSLRIREKLGDLDNIASALQSIGKNYLLLADTTRATEHFRKGLAIYENSGHTEGMAAAWSNLSMVYGNDYRAVVEARIKSKLLWEETNPLHPEAIANLGNLGIIYLDIARFDSLHLVKYDTLIPDDTILLLKKAETYLKMAVQFAEQTGDVDNRSFFIGALAEVQEQQGDYKNAYYNYKFFKETEDSIYSQDSKNKIAEAESRRALEINELALSNQRKTTAGLIGGLGLLAIIGLLLYRQTTARKKTNQRLLVLNKALDEANQAKARFFALMSHDLRSPVSKLIHFLHLQKHEPELLTNELKEIHNRKITEGAEALLENMESMLLWSKSQMEEFKPVKKDTEINALFAALQKSFIGSEPVSILFSNSITGPVKTDEHYLFSILHNLIQNATEALGDKQPGKIECTATKEDESLVFVVSDDGPGYPPAMLNNSKWEINFGSGKKGLGLFIIHDMAKAIGGTILFSNSGRGAQARLVVGLQ